MKKLVALLLALCMVLCLFAGCTKEEAATEEAATEEVAEEAATEEAAEEAEEAPAEEDAAAGMMIGWTFPTSNNEFWQIQKGYFETTCNQFGLEFYSDDCNNDTAEQLADVEAMISKGIDALILAPQDASVIATVCGLCKDAGIPVIVIDRMPDDDVVAGEDYVCFIGPDDTTCGYNQTVALIESGCTKLVALCGFKGTSVAEG
ncbi:MAG: sugar ABC transporter substrate-binding protein, partial [Oscillospiraceae bacterium]|nr:sugar ABC transporter substrate-binding protein [Oscillospiraceae bacterium]